MDAFLGIKKYLIVTAAFVMEAAVLMFEVETISEALRSELYCDIVIENNDKNGREIVS